MQEMNIITCWKVKWILIVSGILIAGLPLLIPDAVQYLYTFIFIGGFISMLGIVLAFLFLRCPYCRGSLNFRGLFPKYCPHCGKKLGE
jgi:hypothetical protein